MRLLTILILIISLSACLEKEGPKVTGDRSSPEYVVTMFFHELFIDQDIKDVGQYSTDKIARLVQHYGSTRSYSRLVLNMQFDDVVIDVERSNNLREVYTGDKVTLMVMFKGQFNGQDLNDFRRVDLIRESGSWQVSKVRDDPFAR